MHCSPSNPAWRASRAWIQGAGELLEKADIRLRCIVSKAFKEHRKGPSWIRRRASDQMLVDQQAQSLDRSDL